MASYGSPLHSSGARYLVRVRVRVRFRSRVRVRWREVPRRADDGGGELAAAAQQLGDSEVAHLVRVRVRVRVRVTVWVRVRVRVRVCGALCCQVPRRAP